MGLHLLPVKWRHFSIPRENWRLPPERHVKTLCCVWFISVVERPGLKHRHYLRLCIIAWQLIFQFSGNNEGRIDKHLMQPLFKKWHVPTCSASCQRDFQSELTVFAPKEAQFLKIIPHDSRHRRAVALLNSTFFLVCQLSMLLRGTIWRRLQGQLWFVVWHNLPGKSDKGTGRVSLTTGSEEECLPHNSSALPSVHAGFHNTAAPPH